MARVQSIRSVLKLEEIISVEAQKAIDPGSPYHAAIIEMTGTEPRTLAAAQRALAMLGLRVLQKRVEDDANGPLPRDRSFDSRLAEKIIGEAAKENVAHNVPDPETGIVPYE